MLKRVKVWLLLGLFIIQSFQKGGERQYGLQVERRKDYAHFSS